MVEETYDVEFDKSNGFQGAHENLDDVGDEPLREAIKNILVGDITRSPSKGVMTHSKKLASFIEHHSFFSNIEPKNIEEALQDLHWINTMHEELNNFALNEV